MTGGTNIAALRTALVAAESKASEAEAKASKAEAKATEAEARAAVAAAKVSDAEAEIAFLKLTIEKLRREFFGQRSERKQRLLDQLELQLDELEASATEDELAAEKAAAETTQVQGFTRRKPARKPFPAHIPRERKVVPPPTSCGCCGSDKLSKIGEDVTETLEVIPRQWKVIQTVREKFKFILNSGLTVTAIVALKGQGQETDASAGALTEGIAVAFHSDIESAADTDYLAWGSWTSVSEDADATQDILQGAFATGSDPFRQQDLAGVTGTARYRGDVTGVYFEAAATPPGGYSFGALVTLEAGFGDAAALGAIGGRIDNFIVQTSEQGDYISRPATSVTLGRTAIGGADSGFFNGAATGTFEDSTALSGRWGGRFYGNGNAGGVPRSVAGTFGAASADETRGFIGGFGAERR